MSYLEDGTPTIDKSISPFFNFIKEYLKRENVNHPKEVIESWKNLETFIEEAFDLAFGEDALHRDWHPDAVIEELTSFSDKALKYDEGEDYE